MEYVGKVGVFEGVLYEVIGFYCFEVDCVMFIWNLVGFCCVCRCAINCVID